VAAEPFISNEQKKTGRDRKAGGVACVQEKYIVSIISSEVVYKALFTARQFAWLDQIPKLYATVEHTFGQCGIELTEIKCEGGQNDPAKFAVIGQSAQAAITAKIMLYGLQLFWNSSGASAPARCTELGQSLVEALIKDCPGLKFKVQAVTWAGHIECVDSSPQQILAQFACAPKGLPGAEAIGLSFSLEPTDQRLSTAVTVQPSVSLSSGIYARFDFNWSGGLAPTEVGSRTGAEVTRVLQSMALDIGERVV